MNTSPGRGASFGLILLLGSLTAFAPLSTDIYLPAFPAIEAAFATTAGAVQGTLAAFFFGFAIGQAMHGPLADRFGRRPPLLGGLALFVLASLACTLAPNIEILALLRFIQAIGACAGMVVARAVTRDLFTPSEAAAVMTRLMLVTGVAPMLAPLLGGWLLLLGGWRLIFLVLAGCGLAALLAAWRYLPETRPAGPGSSLAPLAILGTYGRIGADRRFIAPALTSALATAALFAYLAGSPFVFITHFGIAPERFGWFFGANAFGMIAIAQLNGPLVRRFGPARTLAGATSLQLAAAVLLVAIALDGGGLWAIVPPLFLYLSLHGITVANAAALAMAPYASNAGAASALFGILQFGLGGLSAAAGGALAASTPSPMALCILAGATMSAALAQVTLRGRPAG